MTTTLRAQDQLIGLLRDGLPDRAVLIAERDRRAYERDTAPFGPSGTPAVVVRPETVQQVQHVLRVASHLGVPVVPQGARTGLAGAANAVEGCVVLSMLAMNRILEIDAPNRLARCEPGVMTGDISRAVAHLGLCYPPDPVSADICTIGGNIATGAGGVCCVKYGVTTDYVRELVVVLANGEVTRLGGKTVKNVAGLDLKRLFVGSEGTLGVVVEATLGLRPVPGESLAILAQFPTATLAGEAVAAIIKRGHTPSALELMDAVTTGAVHALGHPSIQDPNAATLIAESDAPDRVDEVAAMARVCSESGATVVVAAINDEESKQLLSARRMIMPALQAKAATMPGDVRSFIEDVAVPRTRLAELIDRIGEVSAEHGVFIATLGHAGDGNLHPIVVFDAADHGSLRRAQHAYDDVMAAGLALGGTITGEHGVGVVKRDWLARELDPVSLRLQQEIKRVFDPAGILNPGKVLA
ncbi:FAD-linked oxidase [Actinorhabdospora filicis]|uniref:FAD-linked oxidase n=1 Tax=Actinorhabdospora filicis TaxID=1785913 RepID=A0A9W6SN00_9ACTN|nr:FAD-linked oxidase C-terminal domain-containing protein [Actinorhabdospora filicis]GLZ79889.1 FAD-linked oxidase [Actinorhabdospora filicis]